MEGLSKNNELFQNKFDECLKTIMSVGRRCRCRTRLRRVGSYRNIHTFSKQ